MRRIRTVGVAFLAVIASSAMLVDSASSATRAQSLRIRESDGGALRSSEPVVVLWNFTVGSLKCRSEMFGHITTNGAKTDTFTGGSGKYVCGAASASGSVDFAFGANGKASATRVSFTIGSCTYTAGELAGTNSLSGPLRASVSGRMATKGRCPARSPELKTTAGEFLGPPGERRLQA